MAELNYREAVAYGIAQEMRRDPNLVMLGEDIAAAGGVFKTTVGLVDEFGPDRVRDTPISEQALLGAAMGAAMTGVPVIAEIMFSDFLAVCWDIVANEIAKSRYMTNGQVSFPLVIRTANGGGVRFGAQHSQSVENWAMMIPGLKVVAPSTPEDIVGLMAAAIRDPDPVVFFEHKALMGTKADVPDGEIVDQLGTAKVLREGTDATIVALAAMVPRAMEAAERLAQDGIAAEVLDIRSLVPLDTRTLLSSVEKTGRLFTVEENPRLCGWGAELVSIVAEEGFWSSTGRASASPRRTCRCRPPPRSRTWRCRRSIASTRPCRKRSRAGAAREQAPPPRRLRPHDGREDAEPRRGRRADRRRDDRRDRAGPPGSRRRGRRRHRHDRDAGVRRHPPSRVPGAVPEPGREHPGFDAGVLGRASAITTRPTTCTPPP